MKKVYSLHVPAMNSEEVVGLKKKKKKYDFGEYMWDLGQIL